MKERELNQPLETVRLFVSCILEDGSSLGRTGCLSDAYKTIRASWNSGHGKIHNQLAGHGINSWLPSELILNRPLTNHCLDIRISLCHQT